jgi:hypothetical protein
MKMSARAKQLKSETIASRNFNADTTFVLFFLAAEFGQIIGKIGFDTIFLAIALGTLLVVPYFLPSEEKQSFRSWVLGRISIAVLGIVVGALFRQCLGVVLPESFRFLPMTLLILTAMLLCYSQFYGLLKLRLAK